MSGAPRSIAMVLLSAIGDVVHGMPVATSLKRAWPDASLTWVIQPAALRLVEPHPDVDDFLVFDRSRGVAAFLDFRRRTRGRRFDLVIDLQVYFKAGVLTGLLRSPRKLGFDRARTRDLNTLFTTERIPARPTQHVQDQYFEFLHHLGVPPVPEWRFELTEDERAAQREFFNGLDRPALAVVLSATDARRGWPPRRYARALEAAESDLGLRPVLVGSRHPRETAVAEAVLAESGARIVDARRDDIRRLAWLLEGSSVVLSPDTGPLHIAAALDRPVVGLYGLTDPRVKGPYHGDPDLVVDRFPRAPDEPPTMEFRPGGMSRIQVRDVLEKLDLAVRRRLKTSLEAPPAAHGTVPGCPG
jgi:heptosyltransferase I